MYITSLNLAVAGRGKSRAAAGAAARSDRFPLSHSERVINDGVAGIRRSSQRSSRESSSRKSKKFTSHNKTNKSFGARLDNGRGRLGVLVAGFLGSVGRLSTPRPLCHHFITLQKVRLPRLSCTLLPPIHTLIICLPGAPWNLSTIWPKRNSCDSFAMAFGPTTKWHLLVIKIYSLWRRGGGGQMSR